MSTKKKTAPKLEAIFTEEVNNQNNKIEPEKLPQENKNVFKGVDKDVNKKIKKISTSIYLPEAVKEKLEEIQFNERKSGKNQNDLILEGIDLLLKNRGFKSIDELVAL